MWRHYQPEWWHYQLEGPLVWLHYQAGSIINLKVQWCGGITSLKVNRCDSCLKDTATLVQLQSNADCCRHTTHQSLVSSLSDSVAWELRLNKLQLNVSDTVRVRLCSVAH